MKTSKYVIVFLLGILIGISMNLFTTKENVPTVKPIIDLKERSIEFPVVAVKSNGEGTLEYATLEIRPGKGRFLIDVNPFVEPDTQYSFETAVKVASELAGVDYRYYDFILSFNSTANLVGGPSAGAMITIATYALLSNKTLRKDVVMTGTINPDGSIGPVGGVLEKALAAAKSGKKLFLVPKGQSVIYKYEKVEKKREVAPGFYLITIEYVPVEVNISDYFEKEYGMKVLEVSNVQEAIKYFIS